MSHNVEVVLVFLTNNPSKPSQSFVLAERQGQSYRLPSLPLGQQEGTLEVAAKLLKQATGLDARVGPTGWVTLTQLPLADNADRLVNGERWIGVPYVSREPLLKAVKEGYILVPLNEANSVLETDDHQLILLAGVKRIV